MMTFLNQFHFQGNQQQAVTASSPAIAVTAGAGAGKTLSLVGRYLHLLEQGYPIRSILAITFTEKAAREMRSRIRSALHISEFIIQNSIHPSEIDSARIGTIHSLCAELLRSYPAEAKLDPQFNVLEEGRASALQAEAVESALAWAANDEQTAALFGVFKENELRQILKALMNRRLDVDSLLLSGEGLGMREKSESASADFHELRQGFSPPNPGLPKPSLREPNIIQQFSNSLSTYLATHLDSQTWLDCITVLNSHRSTSPEDKLELARQSVLAAWDQIQQARASQQWDLVLERLIDLRKSISTQGQKANWDDIETVRGAMKTLRELYDENLEFLAEKSRFSLDEQIAAYLPAVYRLFDQTLREYQTRKDERQSLDFDDLEALTAKLLAENPEVREQIQADLRAVLVDEFQDTNDRQRQIVYALTGFNPQSPIENRQSQIENRKSEIVNLFIVGDSKQSIYRFRSADVAVFRQVQSDIRASGGELIDLDLTFRAHKSLLDSLNALLVPILGETDDPARPYLVPFAPLKAYRQEPREKVQPPFIELHLGLGETADQGRQAAAQALARRLRELNEQEGFAWGDMALLFRSSTAFPVYESALEAAGIPYITVAGRGFYDRPEIRDLLNALAAIADPSDDLALVGFLRSPAFAIPDAEIYKLRFPNQAATPSRLFDSLKEQANRYTGTQVNTYAGTPGNNATRNSYPVTLHAYAVLTELHSLSGRAPAAAILKRFLDLTHYRAILSAIPNGARLIRNVDKLLADAYRSRLVSLTDFLAYIQTLRDVSFREGEAPADPASSGAVQLMTVHKAKGLEFPLTVIADAAHQTHARAALATWNVEHGTLLDLRSDDLHPAAWQLAARREADLEDAEDRRLLYVAATRAKEKLLISGHVKQKKDGLSLNGWLSHFSFLEDLTPDRPLLSNGLSAALYPSSQTDASDSPTRDATSQADSPSVDSPLPPGEGPGMRAASPLPPGEGSGVRADLLPPLAPAPPPTDDKTRARESDPPQRVWRIVSKTKKPRAPSWLVGRLVHEALRRWHFPDDDFDAFIRPFALESGLTDEAEIRAAIHESRKMLERLRAHPLYKELDSAERHHEVPYYSPDGRGIIDLLYHTDAGWTIIDFKTDEVRTDDEARETIRRAGYDVQVARYAQAIATRLGVQAKTRLVFLNVNDEVKIYDA